MAKKGEGSLSWLRDRNRRRVLDVLRISGRTSQADIARATGLSRTTVHTLIGELKEEGMVLEVDGRPAVAGSGRPAVQLALQKTSRAVLGIDFGHSHVQVAVADLAHNVLAERHRDLDVNHRASEAFDSSVGSPLCTNRSRVPSPSGVRSYSIVVEPGDTAFSPSQPQVCTSRRGASTSRYSPLAMWPGITSTR